MIGKAIRARVAEYAIENGLTLVQIDGIPEGFSFKKPDVTIGNMKHEGKYIAFLPLSYGVSVEANSEESLLEAYRNLRL